MWATMLTAPEIEWMWLILWCEADIAHYGLRFLVHLFNYRSSQALRITASPVRWDWHKVSATYTHLENGFRKWCIIVNGFWHSHSHAHTFTQRSPCRFSLCTAPFLMNLIELSSRAIALLTLGDEEFFGAINCKHIWPRHFSRRSLWRIKKRCDWPQSLFELRIKCSRYRKLI